MLGGAQRMLHFRKDELWALEQAICKPSLSADQWASRRVKLVPGGRLFSLLRAYRGDVFSIQLMLGTQVFV